MHLGERCRFWFNLIFTLVIDTLALVVIGSIIAYIHMEWLPTLERNLHEPYKFIINAAFLSFDSVVFLGVFLFICRDVYEMFLEFGREMSRLRQKTADNDQNRNHGALTPEKQDARNEQAGRD